MKKFEAIKTDKNGVTFYSQGALDAKVIIAVDDATKSANLEINNLKKQLEESNRIINEQNMSIQQLKCNLKEEQKKVRVILQPIEKLLLDLDATMETHKDHSLDWAMGFGELNFLIEDLKKKHLPR